MKKVEEKLTLLDINLSSFDDEAGSAAPAGSTGGDQGGNVNGADTGADAQHGNSQGNVGSDGSDQGGSVDYDVKFEEMIKGEYKDAFEKRLQGNLDRRFKKFKDLEESHSKLNGVFEMVSKKYGTQDVSELTKLLEQEYIEERAMNEGIPLDAAKNSYEMEKKLREFEAQAQAAQAQERQQKLIADLETQADKLKDRYPGIDFEESIQDEAFVKRLASLNYDLESAYRLHYFDTIRQNDAKAVKDQIATNVYTKNSRPAENGTQDKQGFKFQNKPFSEMSMEELLEWGEANKRAKGK